MSLIEIFIIIFVHWVADFVCQDEKWALGKSKNWNDLLSHTLTYSLIWALPVCILFGIGNRGGTVEWYVINSLLFVLITFIFHTITDYFTSRIVSKKFAKGEYGSPIPNLGGFTVIGGDQVLHYVQLFLTYWIILNW
jgi:predicted membrane protein